ncbi:MAG: SpoIIE family protein phosphatase [Richelia sp. SM1_7_0]|nr:SpoIIE family protein phosphatase [Richelia sp. SM1_7_0]NJR15931.1 SpoIIE family protein phosphatase [Calothrix sp. CSU_2_0]
MKSLLKPAISLMNHLKYPQKFALISSIFVVPLSIASYTIFSEIRVRTDFTNKQLLGTAYLKKHRNLWEYIPQLQSLRQLNSNTVEIQKIKSQINASFQLLEKVDNQTGTAFKTTPVFNALKQSWQNFENNPNNSNDLNGMITQLIELKNLVGDESNLILDPDLETYYLIFTTLVDLPEIQEHLVDIKLMAQKVINGQQLTPEERVELITFITELREQHQLRLQKNMNIAFNEGTRANLRAEIENTLNAFIQELEQLGKLAEMLADNSQIVDKQDLLKKADKTLKQSFALWDKIIAKQENLLQERVDIDNKKQALFLSLGLITLAGVIYLFTGFYRGVMQTVGKLDLASKQMIEGHINEEIVLDNRDELGEVVKSFKNVASALMKSKDEVSLLNERLNSDNFRMKNELDLTREIQQKILPKAQELAKITQLDIAGFMQAASEIGGDYYDILHQDGRVKIGIGDVTGHGLESGMLMLMVQTAVRTLLESNETDPQKFLNTLNRTVYHNIQRMESSRNMTLCLLDYENGRVRISGQHEEMLIIRRGGMVQRIDTMELGFPIGLEEEISHFVAYADVQLLTGDIIVLYTDGITEAENASGELYGLKRLTEVAKDNWQKSAEEIKQAVIDDLWNYIGEHTIHDDVTLVVLKQNKLEENLTVAQELVQKSVDLYIAPQEEFATL